jgi:3-methyladenine DNA glycosylase/8-oxoguanine DNA glycosylase
VALASSFFAEKAADGALAVHAADAGQPSLPACFKDDTRDTDEVSAKLKQAKEVVEDKEESKLALEADKAAALPPAELTEEEKEKAQLQERLAAFKAQWASFKDKPQLQRLLNALISKVESTPGLVMTDNGPSVISPPYKSDQESCC